MREANEVGGDGFMRDLLQRFTPIRSELISTTATHDSDEIELNLGLSLGGRFGVDPKSTRLVRSSSLAFSTTLLRDDEIVATMTATASLTRTSSLPVETEEEIRRRKEEQCLRRMEAMRKRSEKQKNLRAGKDRASLERISEGDKQVDGGGEGLAMAMALKRKIKIEGADTSPLPGFSNWVSPGTVSRGFRPNSSQGSVGSQGSSSSGVSETESRSIPGLSSCTEGKSSTSIPSLGEENEQKPIVSQKSIVTEQSEMSTAVQAEKNPVKKPKVTDNGTRETGMKVLEDMPCVSTKGDGPNGRRIEGFLYRYRKGEEVRIVCVCHGSFLTPAEFVKHAGGGDVAHPLRHIVVSPSS
ncbi:hypothetical protein GIB67_009546 [Kingdonia uniflora]|uniref:Ninja-family protein n=1 Tax=Kingdonia uniflora TaxID=39325 RepID=A0A7J7NW23_9MAGN|nr:hypothetical protein GIB67_009546 [Kingdonia uniflora]